METKKITLKHIGVICICIIFVAISQSLSLKANIGVAACWDSVSLNVYELTGLKVGTFAILANSTFVLIQLILLGKKFSWIKFLQVPLCILSGAVTNIMYYHVLTFDISSYWMRVVFMLLACLGLSIFVGLMTILDVVTMPVEAVLYVLENKFGISFAKSRMGIDVICMAASLALSLIFGLTFKVREGTVIGFLVIGPLMNLMMKLEKKIPFINNMIVTK